MLDKNIGRYEIRAELGRGGMATVFRAYDPLFEREVAIKVLPHELLHDEQFRGRFDREAKIIARLEHAAIVPVHDVGEQDGRPFFVMRYMTGGSLSSRMKAGPIPLAEAARIVQRIAAALDYAHSKGIVHRDLKPDNILFDEGGDPYISDFGIAKLTRSQTNLTGSRIIGTPTYMSPEQGQGEEIDGRSDIYSLGVILFELLSGKLPYEATTPLGVVFKHVREPIPHILDVNPALPTTTEMVLEKALAKDRADRFSTAADLANAILAVSRGETPDLDQTRPVRTHRNLPAMKQSPGSRLWLFTGLAALLMGMLIWVGIRFSAQPPESPTPIPAAVVAATITETASPVVPTGTSTPTDTPTITPTETVTPTATLPPGIGGADKIALLANNDVYIMDVDGRNLFQLTNDDKTKLDLQWLPGGKEILYIQGGCVNTVNVDTQKKSAVTCFDNFFQFEGFRVSPDGKQAAISMDRRLLIVPFDLEVLSVTHTRNALENLKGCLVYTALAVKGSQWSADGKNLAVLFQSAKDGRMADFIRVMDVHRCGDADPLGVDEFPTKRFTLDGYENNPILPAYSWDGDQRFLLNTFMRNEGYGELYFYDMASSAWRKVSPIGGTCCYRDARFSPDGKYLLFAFQDLRLGQESETQLYYIPFDTIGTGIKYTPIKMPPSFFSNLRERIQPVLRPAIP